MSLRVQFRADSNPVSAIWGDEGWRKWKRIKDIDKRKLCWYWVSFIGPYSPMVWPHSVTSSFNFARNLSIFSIGTLILMLVRSWTINFHWNDSKTICKLWIRILIRFQVCLVSKPSAYKYIKNQLMRIPNSYKNVGNNYHY